MDERIKKVLDKLLDDTKELEGCVTEADEFIAVDDIRRAINEVEFEIYEARKVFERTKEI